MNYLNKKTDGSEYYSMYGVVRLKRRKGVEEEKQHQFSLFKSFFLKKKSGKECVANF